MRISKALLLLLLSSASIKAADLRSHHTGALKKGIDFFLIGDYGYIANMTTARNTFAKMDDVVGSASNETNPEDLIDFMIGAGDNIYPIVGGHP